MFNKMHSNSYTSSMPASRQLQTLKVENRYPVLAPTSRHPASMALNSVVVIFVCLLSLTATLAQQSVSSPGNAPGTASGSYLLSDVESLDLFSGKTNSVVPLVKVGGRGNAGYSMVYPIKDSIWSVYIVPDVDVQVQAVSDPDATYTGRKVFIRPFEFGTVSRRYVGGGGPGCFYMNNGNYPTCYQNAHLTIVFTSADGTEHELFDEKRGGVGAGLAGSYPNQYWSPGLDIGLVFSAKDGSGWTFIGDPDAPNQTDYNIEPTYDFFLQENSGSFPYPGTPNFAERAASGLLKNPDGTVVRFENGRAQWIKDRNGNKTTFVYETNGPNITKLDKVIDSNNRETDIVYGSGYEQVIYGGTGGQSRTITITHTPLQNRLVSGNSLQTIAGLFPPSPDNFDNGSTTFNPSVVSTISLPDSRAYGFYYNSYGEIARMESPAGSAIEYAYGAGFTNGVYPLGVHSSGLIGGLYHEVDPPHYWNEPSILSTKIYRRLLERREYPTGGSTPKLKTTYSRFESTGPYTDSLGKVREDQIDAGTSELLARTDHFFYGNDPATTGASYTGPYWGVENSNALAGREAKTERLNVTSGTVLARSETQWHPSCYGARSSCGVSSNPLPWSMFVEWTRASSYEASSGQYKVAKTEFGYDQYNNLVDSYEYDFGTNSPGSFVRRSHTDYITSSSYTSETGPHLRSLPSQTWTSSDSGGSSKVSFTSYEYDNYSTDSRHASLVGRSSVSGFDSTNYGTGFSYRGNQTGSTSYANSTSQTGGIVSSAQYDVLGNIVKTIDPNGNIGTLTFSDNFGSADSEATTNSAPSLLNGNSSFAFATSTTNSKGWVSNIQFDYFTGQAVNTQNENGIISKTLYSDPLDRPTQVVRGLGQSSQNQTTISYDDTNHKVTTTSDLATYNDNASKMESFSDGFGRTYETRRYENSTDYIKTTQTFDALGRIKRSYNPFRATSDPTYGWKDNTYDSLGRLTVVTASDGSQATTSYDGNAVTETDPAGKLRRAIVDAFGRLNRVDEPDGSNNLGAKSSPNQATYYTYDSLGHMVRVQQGSQNRYFMYDSLGRILRARQPEQNTNSALDTSGNPDNNSWTVGFTYDGNGNILTTTDAKNVTITSTFDSLDRPLTRTYSDGTPTVTSYYDGAGLSSVPNYSKGNLTRVSSTISDTRYTAFDTFGRIQENQQITDGNTYTSSYQYNLAGMLTQETYPSGRISNNDYSFGGNLSKVYGTPYGGSQKTYAENFTYGADQKIQQLKLGNGLWESATTNARLQVTEFKLGTTAGASNVWKLTNEYGELQSGGTVDGTKNNGDIAKQTVTFSGLTNPFVQAFKYDSLNRLIEAKETVNGTQTWIQNWGYDRYGNRATFTQNVLGNTAVSNPSTSASTNRFAEKAYTYDKNGNITVDPVAGGRSFVFNGDNRPTEVKDSSNATIGTYNYDGQGKRVKKVTGTESTVFVYSNGKLVEERNSSTGAVISSYIYAGEQPLAVETSTDTNYTVSDKLGSPRIVTNSSGGVVARRDFLPFGEELYADGTYRKTSDSYSTTGQDAVRQRFTGYPKDLETGLDFAEARYYQNQHGRFTAVDPLLASASSANPQTFNRYIYTTNRPLVLTDPSGLQAGKPTLPVRYEGPVYVDSTGDHFSSTKDSTYSKQFDGSAYATAGGRNYQVSGKGFVEIGIPPPSEKEIEAMRNAAETMAMARSLINAANKVFAYTIDPLHEAWPQESRTAAMHAIGPAAITLAPFVIEGEVAVATNEILAFSQTTASTTFSRTPGLFGGRTVASVISDLQSGTMVPSQVPVGLITRGEVTLIFDTRSAVALIEAGIPRAQWVTKNLTTAQFFEDQLTLRLIDNGLTNLGTTTLRFGGNVVRIP